MKKKKIKYKSGQAWVYPQNVPFGYNQNLFTLVLTSRIKGKSEWDCSVHYTPTNELLTHARISEYYLDTQFKLSPSGTIKGLINHSKKKIKKLTTGKGKHRYKYKTQILEILLWFHWEEVEKLHKFLRWNMVPPTLLEVIKTGIRLMEDVSSYRCTKKDPGPYTANTAGLEAEICYEVMSLRFVPTSWAAVGP